MIISMPLSLAMSTTLQYRKMSMGDPFATCDGLVQRPLSNIKSRHANLMYALTSGLKPIHNFLATIAALKYLPYRV